jgi:O-succinylbenzoate synthase
LVEVKPSLTEVIPVRIWSAPYTLVARSTLSGKALNKIRVGSLLKIETDKGIGYSDLHPWPEWGDLSIDEQLKLLAEGKTTDLSARSLALASLDREARAHGISAFEGLKIPDSHYLVTEINNLKETQLEGIWSEGFRALKFKLGRDIEAEAKKLIELEPALRRFQLRLDFTGLLMAPEYSTFVESLSPALIRKIEFIEDPMPWNESIWSALRFFKQVDFALDRVSEVELNGLESKSVSPEFKWVIVKPAIQDPTRMLNLARLTQARICVTSYLDHPVGQMGAALEAARLVSATGSSTSFSDVVGLCGLVTHNMFEKSEFAEAVKNQGPHLHAPEGVGIGFDRLLEKQNWQAVK